MNTNIKFMSQLSLNKIGADNVPSSSQTAFTKVQRRKSMTHNRFQPSQSAFNKLVEKFEVFTSNSQANIKSPVRITQTIGILNYCN